MMLRPSLFPLCLALAAPGMQDPSAGVFEGAIIDPSCKGDKCGRLYLFNSEGQEIASLQGTNSKVKHKDVATARMVGLGCFQVFKGKEFKSNSLKIHGSEVQALQGFTTIKSVEYSASGCRPVWAGVEVYVLAGVVAVVVLGALGLVVWVRLRRRHRGHPVSQEETDQ